MKQVFMAAALAVAVAPFAGAVEFNKDALKSMQQEGHKIVEESQGRAYRTPNGLCLDVAGDGLTIKPCDANARTQVWQMDGQGRLVASDSRCVAGGALRKCGDGKGQKWRMDDKQRLVNAANKCLQAMGNTPQAGAKVSAVDCSDSPYQVWR